MDTEKGQSLVEFALSFLLLIFLLSGMFELATSFFQYVQLRDAAQEGALYGSTCPNDSVSIEQRVRGASDSPLKLSDPNIQINLTLLDANGNPKQFGTAQESDGLKVQAIYQHHIFMPFLPKLIGRDTITLNASVTDTVLKVRCG